MSLRWEVGSSFHLMTSIVADDPPPLGSAHLFGSGRQALAALLRQGRDELGWRAVHLPSYYCPDVVAALRPILPVRRYATTPLAGDLPAAPPDEAVVAVAYFGREPRDLDHLPAPTIVDATHDPFAPWLARLPVDYVAASLRKCLPVPDGGALWSPTGRPLPAAEPACDAHQVGTGQVLAGMALKAGYLAGQRVAKGDYLQLLAAGEESFGNTPPGRISEFSRAALASFPLARWRQLRIENIATLAAELGHLRVIPSTFGVVLLLDSARQRTELRHALIARGVYPAVLWDLTGTDARPEDEDFGSRMLFLHADFRYTAADMHRVAGLVRDLTLVRSRCKEVAKC